MKPWSVIIPVHNRRDVTLACLRRLADCGAFDRCEIVVVDDGSTDGTETAIRTGFPQVVVIKGDGELWWAGAIVTGMRHALERGAEFIFWLNDDCAFSPGSLSRLQEVAAARRAMTGATCLIPGTDIVVYGGLRRRGFAFDLLPCRPGAVEACDALSGNLVCIPAELARAIALPDAAHLPQAIADIDYALRAGAAGWPVLIVHDATAEAVPNNWENHQSWLLSEMAIADIWASAWRKRSYGYFPTQWHFFRRHWGLRGAAHAIGLLLKRPVIMLVRMLVPQSWLRRIWGQRSSVWQDELRLRAAVNGTELNSPTGRETSRG